MLIYDENNVDNYTIESDDIIYIFKRKVMHNNKYWQLYFSLKGPAYVEWSYETQKEQDEALEKIHKILKATSINTLTL